MPAQETAFLNQDALVWDKAGFDPWGRPTTTVRRPIKVRWEWSQKETTDAQGNPITLSAEVTVAEPIKPGSRMWLGSLDDWVETGSGFANQDLHEVIRIDQVPDVKNRSTFRSLQLMKFRDV